MNIAMLIIDMQKGCLEMGQARETMLEAVDYINEVSGYFRKAGKPVVVIQDMTVDQGPGSPGYEVIDDLVVDETDILVAKTHNNSFYETQLENILHDLGVEFLVVSGFAAEYCVLFSLNGAKERGFGAALLQHGIAGVSKDRVLDTLLIRPVVSYETVAYMLKG